MLERMERTETTLAARAGLSWGYGLGNYAMEEEGFAFRGHGGAITGYLARYCYDADHGVGFVVMMNALDGKVFRKLRALTARFVTRGLPAPSPEPAVAADPRWEGWYSPVNPRNELMAGVTSVINVGKLTAQGSQYVLRHPIVPEQDEMDALPGGLLRDEDRKYANGVLTTDSSGRQALISDGNAFLRGNFITVALPLCALVAALVLLLSPLLFAPVWAVRMALGHIQGPARWTRAWPLAATCTFLALILCPILGLDTAQLTQGKATPTMVAITALGWLFGLVSLAATVQSVRHFRLVHRGVAVHTLLASVSALGIAVWLWHAQLLGIRLWMW